MGFKSAVLILKARVISNLPILGILGLIFIVGFFSWRYFWNASRENNDAVGYIDIKIYPSIKVKNDGQYAFIKDENGMIVIVQDIDGEQMVIGIMDPQTNPPLILPPSKYKQKSSVIDKFNEPSNGGDVLGSENGDSNKKRSEEKKTIPEQNHESNLKQFFKGEISTERVNL